MGFKEGLSNCELNGVKPDTGLAHSKATWLELEDRFSLTSLYTFVCTL